VVMVARVKAVTLEGGVMHWYVRSTFCWLPASDRPLRCRGTRFREQPETYVSREDEWAAWQPSMCLHTSLAGLWLAARSVHDPLHHRVCICDSRSMAGSNDRSRYSISTAQIGLSSLRKILDWIPADTDGWTVDTQFTGGRAGRAVDAKTAQQQC